MTMRGTSGNIEIRQMRNLGERMTVRALGYLGIGVSDVAAWRSFSSEILGAAVAEDSDGLRLRFDARAWRIAVEPTGSDDIAFAGWEVAGPADFEATIARIEAYGSNVTRDDGTLAAKRRVMAVVSFTDPAGVPCELFYGATELQHEPLVSPAGVSGFVMGDQGMGHIVIGTTALDATLLFYRDVLGFGYSDYIDMPVGPDVSIPVQFMHCNARHHSFAFAPPPPAAEAPKLIHFMLQVACVDDVGFGLERVQAAGIELAMTLGRHANDQMLSFYAYTPSGFEFEYGWGARTIDRATWLPVRHNRISSWGHKFVGHGQPAA
jgi:biphenyl-2,3-diol 1,2-dioxygenase